MQDLRLRKINALGCEMCPKSSECYGVGSCSPNVRVNRSTSNICASNASSCTAAPPYYDENINDYDVDGNYKCCYFEDESQFNQTKKMVKDTCNLGSCIDGVKFSDIGKYSTSNDEYVYTTNEAASVFAARCYDEANARDCIYNTALGGYQGGQSSNVCCSSCFPVACSSVPGNNLKNLSPVPSTWSPVPSTWSPVPSTWSPVMSPVTTPSSDSSGLSGGAIAGIVIGSIVFLLLIIWMIKSLL